MQQLSLYCTVVVHFLLSPICDSAENSELVWVAYHFDATIDVSGRLKESAEIERRRRLIFLILLIRSVGVP